LPWFGVVLIGTFIGAWFYPNHQRRIFIRDRPRNIFSKTTCFLGRHSLVIYFLHQLILVAVIYALTGLDQ